MNSSSLPPLLLDAGRLFRLRLHRKPLPNASVPDPSSDSGWRIARDDVTALRPEALSPQHRQIAAAWLRLAATSITTRSLHDIQIVLDACITSGAMHAAPPPTIRGSDIRPWLGDPAAIEVLSGLYFQKLGRRIHISPAPVAQLPPRFRCLLSLISVRATSDSISHLSSTAEALDSAAPDFIALIARMLQLGRASWLKEIVTLPKHTQLPFMRALLTQSICRPNPPGNLRRLHKVFVTFTPANSQMKVLGWMVQHLAEGRHPAVLAAAIRLCKRGWSPSPHQMELSSACSHPVSAATLLALRFPMGHEEKRLVWKLCTAVPGADRALAQLRSLEHESAWVVRWILDYLIDLTRLGADGPPRKTEQSAEMVRLFVAHALRQRWRNLTGWISRMYARQPESISSTTELESICIRVAQVATHDQTETLDYSTAVWDALKSLTRDHATIDRISSLKHVQKAVVAATRSWVKRDLIVDTLHRQDDTQVERLLPVLEHAPVPWCETQASLNAVPEPRLKSIFAIAEEHPLFACESQHSDPAKAVEILQSQWRERCKTNPISRRLLRHLNGTRDLAKHHIDHDMRSIHRGWREAQAHLLRELASSEVWRAFPCLKDAREISEHSLHLALSADSNKRPLRKLLRARENGDLSWPLNHPANQRWLDQLNRNASQLWLEGFACVRKLWSLGEVTLAPEHDPQEVLRMGTLVGSCLSASSFNCHSAAANALDINKRVVYARNGNGRIVGRQLLAISASHTLVCFSPYPTDLPQDLASFFEDFDRVLAREMGIPIHRSPEYEIPTLVAKTWYDDGAWRRFTRQCA